MLFPSVKGVAVALVLVRRALMVEAVEMEDTMCGEAW